MMIEGGFDWRSRNTPYTLEDIRATYGEYLTSVWDETFELSGLPRQIRQGQIDAARRVA